MHLFVTKEPNAFTYCDRKKMRERDRESNAKCSTSDAADDDLNQVEKHFHTRKKMEAIKKKKLFHRYFSLVLILFSFASTFHSQFYFISLISDFFLAFILFCMCFMYLCAFSCYNIWEFFIVTLSSRNTNMAL